MQGGTSRPHKHMLPKGRGGGESGWEWRKGEMPGTRISTWMCKEGGNVHIVVKVLATE